MKNGAQLLDRLVKDIVTESDLFDVEKFIPLLQASQPPTLLPPPPAAARKSLTLLSVCEQKYIRRTNPYIRILLVGWITVLDQVSQSVGWLGPHTTPSQLGRQAARVERGEEKRGGMR